MQSYNALFTSDSSLEVKRLVEQCGAVVQQVLTTIQVVTFTADKEALKKVRMLDCITSIEENGEVKAYGVQD